MWSTGTGQALSGQGHRFTSAKSLKFQESADGTRSARGVRMMTTQNPASLWRSPGLLSVGDRIQVLRFAASFVWADLEVVDSERRFLAELARELHVVNAPRELAGLLARPPGPEDVDPAAVHPALADIVRHAALRAIAADGRVDPREMEMFELLDDLLPRTRARSHEGVGPPQTALVA